jgi:glutaredoxin-like YruB-family protein
MQWTKVSSFSQLPAGADKPATYFLFFHKPGSEASECARANLDRLPGDFAVMEVDVTQTRDVHPHFGIGSVPVLAVVEGGKLRNLVKGCQSPEFYRKILAGEGVKVSAGNGEAKAKRVTVYSTPSCPYCNKLKQYLNKHGVRYTDVNVAANPAAAEEMVRKSGQRGVPQTDINGRIIIGFDVPKISRLLDIPTE